MSPKDMKRLHIYFDTTIVYIGFWSSQVKDALFRNMSVTANLPFEKNTKVYLYVFRSKNNVANGIMCRKSNFDKLVTSSSLRFN